MDHRTSLRCATLRYAALRSGTLPTLAPVARSSFVAERTLWDNRQPRWVCQDHRVRRNEIPQYPIPNTSHSTLPNSAVMFHSRSFLDFSKPHAPRLAEPHFPDVLIATPGPATLTP
ncbi:hypothetical protein PTTG_28101 [Puccinia triticina 1-1 BBBD Race 1]|uniref:Uncharacterized protein n=1 Tax=Puccinia triticina (isolate 1-1 / race 1 (BBBD)) TaxID=630390 RepID=A0A180GE93_PUCT1|nr:hypothetical protein PTTG_28101 [Puccinia triticina 1-1 BBBD Race 1]